MSEPKGGVTLIIIQEAQAGSEAKSDILVMLEPAEQGSGIRILLQSPVELEFGRQIRQTLQAVLKENGVTDAVVKAQDKGAMDFTIRARMETAVRRALK